MAINTVNQRGKLEHKEDKVIENLNQIDGKSSIFSQGESSEQVHLKKINNIYTSPFFLMDTQTDKNNSVYQIW